MLWARPAAKPDGVSGDEGPPREAQGDRSNRESTREADTRSMTLHGQHKEADGVIAKRNKPR
jgi:hypothetical protein